MDDRPPPYGPLVMEMGRTASLHSGSGSGTGSSSLAEEEGEPISPMSMDSATTGERGYARGSSSSSNNNIKDGKREGQHHVIGVLVAPDRMEYGVVDDVNDRDSDQPPAAAQQQSVLHRIFTIAVAGTGVSQW